MKVILTKLTDKITGAVYVPPMPVNLTELYTVDHDTGTVFQRTLAMADIRPHWQGLPDELSGRAPDELDMVVALVYDASDELDEPPFTDRQDYESDAWKVYDDSHDRFGWRKPGMHVRKVPQTDRLHTHGPGKRKKGKRK